MKRKTRKYRNKLNKSRRLNGGRAGKLNKIIPMDDSVPTLGAGSFGTLVLGFNPEIAIKLINDVSGCIEMYNEAKLQIRAREILNTCIPEVKVPEVHFIENKQIIYKNKKYLCGLGMTYIPFPKGYNECVHITLGYYGDDINTSWGVETLKPVGPENPTRGFFADANHLEDIWEQEGSDMTIEQLATIMGRATGCLVRAGYLPLDVEWIWSNGHPWLIDFGMCKLGQMSLEEFLDYPVYGPNADVYIPKQGDEGYDAFMTGYFGI